MIYTCYIYDGLKDETLKERVIEAYLKQNSIELGKYEIECEEGGRPYIKSDKKAPCFNVSDSGNLWMMIIGEERCSIDVEQLRPTYDYSKIVERHFSENEKAYVNKYGVDGFYRLWVRREALQKFIGTGVFGKCPELIDGEGYLVDEFNLILNDGSTSKAYIKDVPISDDIFCCYATTGELDDINFVTI